MGPKRSLGRHPPFALPLRGPLGWWEGWSPIFKSQINFNYRISKPYRLEFGAWNLEFKEVMMHVDVRR